MGNNFCIMSILERFVVMVNNKEIYICNKGTNCHVSWIPREVKGWAEIFINVVKWIMTDSGRENNYYNIKTRYPEL